MPTCQKIFLYLADYNKHLITHRRKDRELLKERKKLPNPPSPRSAKCFNCDKVFSNRLLLNRHLKTECDHLAIPDLMFLLDDANFNIEKVDALQGCMSEYHLNSKNLINSELIYLEAVEPNIARALK